MTNLLLHHQLFPTIVQVLEVLPINLPTNLQRLPMHPRSIHLHHQISDRRTQQCPQLLAQTNHRCLLQLVRTTLQCLQLPVQTILLYPRPPIRPNLQRLQLLDQTNLQKLICRVYLLQCNVVRRKRRAMAGDSQKLFLNSQLYLLS